jgi:hypothetical protein|tara:strand:- start:507 stop:929 length:423 start_codon:yes stop_codon:yes gene_type:complete
MANPLYGQNEADDALDVIAALGSARYSSDAGAITLGMRVHKLSGKIDADSTTNLDMTPDEDTVSLLGGYIEFKGISGSGDFDVDITAAHSLVDQITEDGKYALKAQYIASGEVIRVDPQTASDTDVYVQCVLITSKVITS